MTHLVVDASVAIKWLLPEIHAEAARRVLSEDFTLLAPDLIWAEVGNALWKQWRRGQMAGEVMQGLLQDFQRAPLEISSSGSLVTVACDLARRFERSFYDSLYLALPDTGHVRWSRPIVSSSTPSRATRTRPA